MEIRSHDHSRAEISSDRPRRSLCIAPSSLWSLVTDCKPWRRRGRGSRAPAPPGDAAALHAAPAPRSASLSCPARPSLLWLAFRPATTPLPYSVPPKCWNDLPSTARTAESLWRPMKNPRYSRGCTLQNLTYSGCGFNTLKAFSFFFLEFFIPPYLPAYFIALLCQRFCLRSHINVPLRMRRPHAIHVCIYGHNEMYQNTSKLEGVLLQRNVVEGLKCVCICPHFVIVPSSG